MTTLFGDEPKAKKKSKRTETIGYNPVTIWAEEYKHQYHVNPLINGRDARACVDAAEGADAETFRKMCRCFLECDDRQFVNSGHRVQDLNTCKNRWLADARGDA